MSSIIPSAIQAKFKEPLVERSYIPYTNKDIEPTIPNEGAKIDKLIGVVNNVQRHNYEHHRHGFRATHVKSQGIVKGKITVPSALPAHLKQGLFSKEGEYDAVLRYANEPSFLKDDKEPGPRGCAVKIFGVDPSLGPHLDEAGTRTHTQDFLFNNAPVLELKDLDTTIEIFSIRERNFDDPRGLQKQINSRSDRSLQQAPAQLPNQHFTSYTMYSQSAFRFGQYVAKFALFPLNDPPSTSIDSSAEFDQHSRWLREYFSSHELKYEFRVQLLEDLSNQPVEDCSVPWDETLYPFQTVATLSFPKQSSFDLDRVAFWDNNVKTNVWSGLESHRPLGSVNRLRREVYKASVKQRQNYNSTDVQEISSIDQIP